MSVAGFLKGYWHRAVRQWTYWRLRHSAPRLSLARAQWERSLADPTAFYLECARFFEQGFSAELKKHRTYFSLGQRGFGENAFHVMWDMLLREFKPADFLEIGVFRGQVISLVSLWSRLNSLSCEVVGISPFSGAQDSVSKFPQGLDYWNDTLRNFEHFGLAHPRLVRAFSTDPQALEVISSRHWEMIYIDGNHDLDVVRKDWQACSSHLKVGAIVVLDDAGSTTAYRPPCFSSAGLPGPSQVAQELDRSRFREILQVGHNRVFLRAA